MKIGIFGGSFNPIHFGHLKLAEWVVNAGFVDKVWLMVSPQNPLKQQKGLLPEQLRYEMAKQACENVQGVEASDFEFALERPNYTWHTLDALRKAYPAYEFSLIIGEDNWALFDKWARCNEILATTELLVYPRGTEETEVPLLCIDSAKSVRFMYGAPLFPFSSTEVRGRLSRNEDVNDMVPMNVVNTLRDKGLSNFS